MSKPSIEFQDIHAEVDGKAILKGVSLAIQPGEKHALMGPNGSGKSTLANILMGHPSYTLTQGKILLAGQDVTEWAADERARAGLFLAFQYPVAIPGVSVANFLRAAVNARRGEDVPIRDFRQEMMDEFKNLGIHKSFAGRYLNDGFSGGEKKRLEILQMAMLKPVAAILDETDSGLDIDALKIVAEGINRVCHDQVGVLLVTHYQRLLDYVKPDHVHILRDGQLVRSGGPELALELEDKGYDILDQAVGA